MSDSYQRGPIDPKTGQRLSSNIFNIQGYRIQYYVPPSPNPNKNSPDESMYNAAMTIKIGYAWGQTSGNDVGEDIEENVTYYNLANPYKFPDGSKAMYLSDGSDENNIELILQAAQSGNYIYLDEDIIGTNFNLITVTKGVITNVERFEKNDQGLYVQVPTK